MDATRRGRGVFTFAEFRLDPVRGELTRGGAPIALPPTAFDTLLFLVENPGRLISKSEFLEALWPDRVVEESNITQTIFVLRQAMAVHGEPAAFIATAHGRGYRFTAPVVWEPEPVASAFGPTAGRPPDVVPPRRFPWVRGSRAVALAAAGLAAVALAGLAAFHAWGPAFAGTPRTVVLSEFENATGNPIFDRSLRKVLEIDLSQSPVVTVLSDSAAQDTLALMTRPKTVPLTPSIAREICVRNDGSAVLEGGIAQIGTRYLVTLVATECGNGTHIASEQARVRTPDAVVSALDKMAAHMRERLGESHRSVSRFNVPIAHERTVSLAALKAYSEARWLYDHGKATDAIPYFKHAVDLDPNFAIAYRDLAGSLYSLHDRVAAAGPSAHAYALRDTVGDRERLRIVAGYNKIVTKDMRATIANLRVWTTTYLTDNSAWGNLSDSENWIGEYPEAIAAGEQAVKLGPDRESSYTVLARALMHAGRLADAAAICARAVAKGLAGDNIHSLMMEIAVARGDLAGAAREAAWGRANSHGRILLIYAARQADVDGQVRRAEAMFADVAAASKESGLADFTLPTRARQIADFGLANEARELLERADADSDADDYLFTMAEVGDENRASRLLAAALASAPADTLLNEISGPEIRAVEAIRDGRPRDAIADLGPVHRYDMLNCDDHYLRGQAMLAAGDARGAASEFEFILAHPGLDPLSTLHPLARLGLARAERMAGNRIDSRRDYQTFLALWRNADTDLPLLREAKMEYAGL